MHELAPRPEEARRRKTLPQIFRDIGRYARAQFHKENGLFLREYDFSKMYVFTRNQIFKLMCPSQGPR